MKFDDNEQMVSMLDHAKGSLENKIRQAYNSGYNDGFKAGVFEAWDDMRKQLDKSLRQTVEQTEPQRGCDADCNEDCTECAKETELWKAEQTEPSIRKFSPDIESGFIRPQTEPQTDCSWK